MEDLVIIGASGFGKEVAWLVETINLRKPTYRVLGFIDDAPERRSTTPLGYPVLGDIQELSRLKGAACAVAIGNPRVRRKVVATARSFGVHFPTLVHPTVSIHRTVELGEGVILCANAVLTVEIAVGQHVHLNLTATVGHGARLGDFSTVYPGTNISGDVTLGPGVSMGIGSSIIQGVQVGAGTTVGSGASVVRNLPANVVAVGVPAKQVKELEPWE